MRILLLLPIFLTLSACGFSPMYGTLGKDRSLGSENYMSYVAIANIPDREGQFLRNALIDRLHRNGTPIREAYTLYVENLEQSKRDLDITKNSNATRAQLLLSANIMLRDNVTGETLLERNVQSITSYNILGSEFATRISEDNTRLNALDDLARQIELQLNLYFNAQ